MKHIRNCKTQGSQQRITDAFVSTSREDNLPNKIKKTKINIASYIVEHNIPFLAAEHIPHLIKAVCPESEVAKGLKLGRTKTAGIIKNVIGETEKELLCDVMRNRPFSIIVDESTDTSTIKNLCIVVRTVVNNEVADAFFDLIPVDDATAVGIHKEIIRSLEKYRIPWRTNLIGKIIKVWLG